MEWQPIETAPKDGTWFLSAEANGARWIHRYNGAKVTWGFEAAGVGWFSTNLTHWMPLPAPTSAEGEGR